MRTATRRLTTASLAAAIFAATAGTAVAHVTVSSDDFRSRRHAKRHQVMKAVLRAALGATAGLLLALWIRSLLHGVSSECIASAPRGGNPFDFHCPGGPATGPYVAVGLAAGALAGLLIGRLRKHDSRSRMLR